MKKQLMAVGLACFMLLISSCAASDATHEKRSENHARQTADSGAKEDINVNGMKLKIAKQQVPVKWEKNPSVDALRKMLPLTVKMSMYGGFEQVGSLGRSLPRNDREITTSSGDIVLYSGNQIVVFYGSNSWAYTRLGHIGLSQPEMAELLSHGDVEIKLTEE